MSGSAVLVVDDDEDVRACIMGSLRDEGVVAFESGSGPDALRALDALPRPCLILLDQVMPGMSGLQFLEALSARSDATDFRVVLVTGSRLEAVDSPRLVTMVPKPFDLDVLMQLVSAHG